MSNENEKGLSVPWYDRAVPIKTGTILHFSLGLWVGFMAGITLVGVFGGGQ